MGVAKLWDELAPQRTVSLADLSQECMAANLRPLRLAVDIFPRIFGDKGTTDLVRDTGGMNHAAKNVFYFALHFLEAGVQPLFVYDGPNKPALKRGNYHIYSASSSYSRPSLAVAASSTTRSEADKDRDQSVEHVVRLTKNVFDLLGLPWVVADGEGEAECCALERAGLVDGIVTTDGDAFVFGGKSILRLCNKTANQTRKAEVYDARSIPLRSAAGRELRRGFWLLLALVNGGDYHHGLAGCGSDTARKLYDAFGVQLDKLLSQGGAFLLNKVVAWSKSLSAKLGSLPETWARTLAPKLTRGFPEEIVRYYLSPAVHSESALRASILPGRWTQFMKIVEFRDFSKQYFD